MRNHLVILFVSVAAAGVASGCKSTECGEGTIERNGTCQPADETTDPAKCGPMTELVGNECVPLFPPTQCDPSSTVEDKDPDTGVITCVGTGTSSCSGTFACPQPTSGTKQTICGQLYDFETNMPFQGQNPTGKLCTAGGAGPCSLDITAYDAIAFGMGQQTPLTDGGAEIDDCGRFRVKDIDVPSGPFIGLGIDDAGTMGPQGTTITVGIAMPKRAGMITKDVEGWIVKMSTTQMWESSGGPPLSGGYYITVFRQHSLKNGMDPFLPAPNVTFTKSGSPVPAQDTYFAPQQTTHQTLDNAQTATGANGTALITGATVMDNLAYSGMGGLSDTTNCRWEPHAGATLPFIAFIQIFRPTDQIGLTCPL
jgi:hypothetical protein